MEGENLAGTPRQRLLDAAIEHLASHGVGETSLRGLAEAIGTSHRMLLYHFGSKGGLLVAVVHAVEARQRSVLTDLRRELGDAATPVELTRRLWKRLSDPEMAPYERLFFELYGRALAGEKELRPLLEGIVDTWAEPAARLLEDVSELPADRARAQARLGVAVIRGLLLDLLAGGAPDATDQALERFLALWEESPPEEG